MINFESMVKKSRVSTLKYKLKSHGAIDILFSETESNRAVESVIIMVNSIEKGNWLILSELLLKQRKPGND